MNEVDVVDIGRNAMWVIIKVAGPIMFLGLVSGLIIALFQALTTIQEMTLTFVPKIIVIFIGIVVLLPFMINTVTTFADTLFDRISAL
ncbi:MAG TPA: flagellar biosynthetic protein FliQ [Rhodospirillaceae bacterium]|nr:flagellar biosynthetic protein FliQ [Magnetovibrio sp.]HCS70768.1 flagellar biosynthetic protein FliQ [Rhodospirillaceae bacterium]|tara:strand:+ start:113 stop:376 length:264 start_codon:yes stop_codon:yes gene_type:complete